MSDPSTLDLFLLGGVMLVLGMALGWIGRTWVDRAVAALDDDEAVEVANRPYRAVNPVTGRRPRADQDWRA